MNAKQTFGWRELLRRKPWITMLWALMRAKQQERSIRQELKYYRLLSEKRQIPYELDEFTLRELLLRRLSSRNISAKRQGDLHIVYATSLGNWEKHNIPPALEQFGTLTPFYLKERGFDSNSPNWLQTRYKLDHALIQFVREAAPKVDVLVSYLSGWHISPETIQTINQMRVATCAFWWDDRLSFRGTIQSGRYSGSALLGAAYDLNLTNASDSIVKYLVEGALAMFWPEAANQEHFRPLNLPFQYDVSFVGACYGQRPAYINYLRRHGIKVAVFGPGWPKGPLSEDEMVEVYAQSRINLGFSGIGYSMKEMCLKGRDFEVPMSGALYLTSEQPDLHRVYKVGKEVVTYRNKADCLHKIRYLLDHSDESAQIRKSARDRCIQDHTWDHRFRKAFLMMGLLTRTKND